MLHHVDVHVRDLAGACRLFDALCEIVRYRRVRTDTWWATYEPVDTPRPRIIFTTETGAHGGSTRLGFAVADRDAVDRAARVAASNGAQKIEGPMLNPEYEDDYYAAFFEDADGNRYEITADAAAVAPAIIARIWRSRVKPGQLRAYRKYIRATGLEDYRNTEGNRGAWILSTSKETHDEVITLSFWDSRAAVVRFSGEPIERAQYYPDDEKYLLDRPESVEHFDID